MSRLSGQADAPKRKVALAVLTGGKSSRMGSGKEHLAFGEQTFLGRICSELSFFTEKYLSVNGAQNYRMEGYRTVEDAVIGIGPLGGIVSVLRVCRADALLVVACDMPYYMAEDARETLRAYVEACDSFTAGQKTSAPDIVLAVTDGRDQMLAALYAKSCLDKMEEMIRQKDYRLRSLLEKDLHVRRIHPLHPEHFQNINTPQEYRKLSV